MKILGQEMATLTSLDADSSLPDHSPEGMKRTLEKYRSSGRFKSKDGLENHFQVKHW